MSSANRNRRSNDTVPGLGPEGLLSSTGYLLARVGSEARRQFVRKLAKRDLRLYHHALLLALDELGPSSQQQLAAIIGVDPRNIVSTIDFLERRGLVTRAPDPDDRRRYGVTLTQSGRQILRQLRHDADQLEQNYLSPLSSLEKARLHDMLLRLLAGFIEHASAPD
jgi:DNA-binding MarR family transcriptional regulator